MLTSKKVIFVKIWVLQGQKSQFLIKFGSFKVKKSIFGLLTPKKVIFVKIRGLRGQFLIKFGSFKVKKSQKFGFYKVRKVNF